MENALNAARRNAAAVASLPPWRLTGKLTNNQRESIAKDDAEYKTAYAEYLDLLKQEELKSEGSPSAREDELTDSFGSRLLPGYNDTALHNILIARDGLQFIHSELELMMQAIVGVDEVKTDTPEDGVESDFLSRKRAATRDGMVSSDRRKHGATRMSSFWHKIQENATDLSVKLVQYRHILGMAEVTGTPPEAKRLKPDLRLADDLKDCLFNIYNRAQRKLKSMDL